jgi:hypothetical protein
MKYLQRLADLLLRTDMDTALRLMPDVTNDSGTGSTIVVKDEGNILATDATTLNFVGSTVEATGVGAEKTITILPATGVTDHGALTGLTGDDHLQYLHKDITRAITVGYTTDIDTGAFSATVTPNFTLEYLKTMTVTSDFTLNVPSGGNGHGEYYLTVTGVGPWTLTPGTNLAMLDSNVTLTVGENYLLNIRRFSATNAVAQLLQMP